MRAGELARVLGFKRSGNQWVGCCVAHDDRNPSMIIYEGRNGSIQVRCLAGVCTSDEIVDVLRARGLWGVSEIGGVVSDTAGIPVLSSCKVDPDRHRRLALRIWEDARDAHETPAQVYLNQRGLGLPAGKQLIRYHPRCPMGNESMPALIALMRDVETFEPIGINRLFLESDALGVVSKIKGMMLGRAGAMMVTSRHDTFWDDLSFCPQLFVCEGLETGLALLDGRRCVWALGSAGAIARFPVIFGVGKVVICADNDANNVGLSSAIECAERWNASSHQKAVIILPGDTDSDFADVLVPLTMVPKHG